jgi:hypothetical protein
MLRITRIEASQPVLTLKLEGKLIGPWVEELARLCCEPTLAASRPHLDLSSVTFVDAAGLSLLHELLAQGVTVTSCSGLVAELLRRESR